jgi:Sterol carrier protein domain
VRLHSRQTSVSRDPWGDERTAGSVEGRARPRNATSLLAEREGCSLHTTDQNRDASQCIIIQPRMLQVRNVMSSNVTTRAATPDDHMRLRALVATERDDDALRELERHRTRPRYRPAFTRIAAQADTVIGYALIGHERWRLGAATLEIGCVEQIYTSSSQHAPAVREALIGDCLSALLDNQLPLATLRGPAEQLTPFGFAPYRLRSTGTLATTAHTHTTTTAEIPALRAASASDLEDLAALYEASYHTLPLSQIRAAPDWRAWMSAQRAAVVLEDRHGRLTGYALIEPHAAQDQLRIVEAASADSGAARGLCAALLDRATAEGRQGLTLVLPAVHVLARAALHMGGAVQLTAPPAGEQAGRADLAGIVELPGMLEALAPEFERRLARSRYADWSGNLRIELETERITLTLAAGHVTVIDGVRPADVRLRTVALPALAQLCLGYRDAADLRATGGLDCADTTLGLIDTLFPAIMP